MTEDQKFDLFLLTILWVMRITTAAFAVFVWFIALGGCFIHPFSIYTVMWPVLAVCATSAAGLWWMGVG